MKKDLIRVGNWAINLDLDLLVNGNDLTIIKFSEWKNRMMKDHPSIVEKFRLKSRVINGKIEKKVAWDSVLDESIKKNLL